MKYLLMFLLFFSPLLLLAQCDTSFYNFKRAIIETLSDNLKRDMNIKSSPKTIELEFSDYTRFRYSVSDPKSTLGFACVREGACNIYADSICISKIMSPNMYGFDKTLFENFMSSDDLKICDSSNYRHTLVRLIETPLEGWAALEKFYFRFYDNDDLNTYYKGKKINLTIPVYIFLDKKLKKAIFYSFRINSTQKKDIVLEKSQTVKMR